MVGADPALKKRILGWALAHCGDAPYLPVNIVPTITPLDVRNLVEAIF
jgi:hypothetical protein